MRFFRELRILFKDVLIPFLPKEVKEAYGILHEIDRELENNADFVWNSAWTVTKKRIENYLIVDTHLFLNIVRVKKLTPREIVYNMTYNISSEAIQITDPYISTTSEYEKLNRYIKIKINKMSGHT